MAENHYRSTTLLPRENCSVTQPRWYGVGLSIFAAIVGLMFAWQALVIYAFSAMVDPQISGDERTRIVADRFLFGDGSFQIVVVCVFVYMAATGLLAALLFLAFAIFHQPSLKLAAIISCWTGALVTMLIIGYFLTR